MGVDHGFSSNAIEQAALDEGAYDAPFDFALHVGYRGCIEMAGSVKDDAGIAAFIVATRCTCLKHAVDDADMKMHMRVKAGTKTMDENARTDVSIAFIDTGCAGTVLMEVAVDHAQKNPQRGIECLGIAA